MGTVEAETQFEDYIANHVALDSGKVVEIDECQEIFNKHYLICFI